MANPMKPKILVVDDTQAKRDFHVDVISKYLGSEWELLLPDPVGLVDSAHALVLGNPDLAIAVVDAYLEDPQESKPKGITLLMHVKEYACGCYKILISTYIRMEDELPPSPPVDEFVHTRFVGGRSPVDGLQEALRRGKKYHQSRILI